MRQSLHRTLSSWRGLVIAFIGGVLLLVAGPSVFASLTAQTSNASPQTVASGTLKLTMSSTNPSAGFSTSITNLAPGDAVNRYIDLTNSGTLDSQGLTLGIASTGTASLITDGVAPVTTKALRVTVRSCVAAWNQTNGTCADAGGAVTQIASAPLSTFASAQSFTDASLAAAAGLRLQIQVSLPDQNETTTNGVLPTNTVQNGSVGLTYTFTEVQRTATTTNS
ncbi:MAG: M73 family metallopeptidase [Acidobacteria bacterium]|nr:M73 family metallopeptidase [Acidobacteriota bacterium]